jgi:CRISPR-associated endonuclease/helicase Cas3
LEQIQWLLKEKCPVLCVSTQLIECGVDISFGAVIRFAAGLDSILQAAGRCNRHSEREKGRVHIVTVPQDQEALTSLVDIKRGKEVLLRMTYEDGCPMCEPEADLTDPALIRNYFEYYFFQQKDEMTYPLAKSDSLLRLLGKNDKNPGFDDRFSMLQQSFREAGCRFHPIDSPTQGVLVPYGRGKALIAELCSASGQYAKRDLLREAQQYTVNIYPNLMRQLDEAGALHCIKELDILTLGSGYYDESLGVVAENMGYMDTHNL